MDWTLFGHITSVVLIDYFAVIVGVVMGALFAVSRKLDVVGAVTLALLTGFGGGIIRDILLHDQGFFFMSNPYLIIICIAIAMAVFTLGKHLARLEAGLSAVDALSVALFALAGVDKAWSAEVGFVYAVLLGTITAVGGGALASIAIAEMPRIFQPSSYYAIAGLGGSIAFSICALLGAHIAVSSVTCVAVCLLLRGLSLKFNLKTKQAE